MDLNFQNNGNLQTGIHEMTIGEFEIHFGYNEHRKKLLEGLKRGIAALRDCGCRAIYVDGSFVTTKVFPGDFDACWDANGVDLKKLKKEYGTILDFTEERKNQKRLYFGEFFPAQVPADEYMLYIDFFQKDRDNNPKGIVLIQIK